MELIGRATELERLIRLLDAVHESGGSVVVRGDPGIGKSALLDAARRHARSRGFRVLVTDGTPGESHLPLAALHRLLQPALVDVDALPEPERRALRGAFGLADTPAPEIFRIALAVLNLLTELAAQTPVLLTIESAQWLDRQSAEVLAFVARRIDADPVLLLADARPSTGDVLAAAATTTLELSPLSDEAASALLHATAGDLTPEHRDAILHAAAGNPLALIELPRALSAGAEPDGALPLTGRLERAFAGRLSELPAATRDLVLLAALSSDGRVETLLSAAQATEADLAPAVTSDLIDAEHGTVRFRHPLVRSAVQSAAPLEQRMAAHAALAATDALSEDRRAWHRALATLGADESVAADLEAAADRALTRGAVGDAVTALERAADHSSAAERRTGRLLRAAELAADIGQTPAYDLGTLEDADRLRAEALLEAADHEMLGGEARVDELLAFAEATRDDDLALRFLLLAGLRCWNVDYGGGAERRVLEAIDRLDHDDADPRAVVARAYAMPLEQAATVRALVTRHNDLEPSGLHLLGHAAACVGAFHEAFALCGAAADGLRAEGRLALLARALRLQAWSGVRTSRWDVAAEAAAESARLGAETRQPLIRADGLSASAMLSALRGDLDRAAALAAEAEALAQRSANQVTLATIQYGRAIAAAGDGRPGDAFAALIRVFRPGDPAHQRMQAAWAIGSLAEHAVLSGREDAARDELARLDQRLDGHPPTGGVLLAWRYARALLAEPGDADARFREALDAGDWPFDLARVRLAYGAWLRRNRRVPEAREPLRAARDVFDRLGAAGWAERTRAELRAAGEDSTRRGPEAWDELTPQEMQIARMVAQGLTNKEIAERLYLSHRTVASHLYRMFPKLGVTSRAQIARVVGERD
jgi:DNA-binding CsgD family transcriptional regulator